MWFGVIIDYRGGGSITSAYLLGWLGQASQFRPQLNATCSNQIKRQLGWHSRLQSFYSSCRVLSVWRPVGWGALWHPWTDSPRTCKQGQRWQELSLCQTGSRACKQRLGNRLAAIDNNTPAFTKKTTIKHGGANTSGDSACFTQTTRVWSPSYERCPGRLSEHWRGLP